ncbi:MAG: HDIG domain-containing metalloprotein [Syntrophobacteraceae bacterium]
MKIILNIILVLVSVAAYYAEDIYLLVSPLSPERSAYITVHSRVAFNFDQEKAFGSKRKIALSQYIPIYTHEPARSTSARKKMQDLIDKVSSLHSQDLNDGGAFTRYLKKEYGVELSPEAAAQIIQYPNLKNLLEGILTIEESILEGKIVEDPEPLKGKKTAEVLYADPIGTIAYPATELTTLEGARHSLRTKVSQVYWQVDPSLLDSILQISLVTLLPNLRYDKKENDRRIEEIIRRYPSKIVSYQVGEVLVPFRKSVTEEDILLLAAHQEAAKPNGLRIAPWIVFSIALTVILHHLFLSNIIAPKFRRKPPYLVLLTVLITTVVTLKAGLLFTSFSIYALPIGMLPLLLLMLIPDRTFAPSTTVVGVLLASLFTGSTFGLLLFFAFGTLFALLTCPVIRKRHDVGIPSLAIAAMNVVIVLLPGVDFSALSARLSTLTGAAGAGFQGEILRSGMFHQAAWAFAGGLAAGPSALILLPLLERLWNTASTFELHRYTDPQHPLLKKLLTKAPGTYQHTMTVALLAEAVGEAVGANTLLLRAGAFFHDVGKSAAPQFFIENQFNHQNPHDEIDPRESARIICDHVLNGKTMALDAGVPDVVADFIPQHHGTLLVEYFFHKASSEDSSGRPRADDFRYPGPKPQSVEAAILMICDAVEAASRTLQQPTPENLRKLILLIIEKRLTDGQFDECDLSTRDMGQIVHALTDSLAASFHSRVEYPWQQQQEKKVEAGPTV